MNGDVSLTEIQRSTPLNCAAEKSSNGLRSVYFAIQERGNSNQSFEIYVCI